MNRILVLFLTVTALKLCCDFYAYTDWSGQRAAHIACKWTVPVTHLPSGPYEIFTCVTRDKIPKIPGQYGILPALVTKLNMSGGHLSFEDLVNIPDGNWKRPVEKQVFNLYGQAIVMSLVVDFVKKTGYFPEAPINNYTIRFLNVASAICPGDEHRKTYTPKQDFIVIVKSGVYNFQSRRQIRVLFKDMAQEGRVLGKHLALVFSVGLPRRANNNFFERDGFNITLPGRAGQSLLNVGPRYADIMLALRKETEIHGDLLVGDYEDTYYNLTLKMHYTFVWAARFCRPTVSHRASPLFIFLDDDFSFNVANLVNLLRSVESTEPPKRLLIGNNRMHNPTIRPSAGGEYKKWALSKREMPSPELPPHCNGAFYILDYTSLEEIAIAMHFITVLPLDDVWLGLVMTRLGLQFEKPYQNAYNPLPSANADSAVFAPLEVFIKRRHDKRLLERYPVRRPDRTQPKIALARESSSTPWSTVPSPLNWTYA